MSNSHVDVAYIEGMREGLTSFHDEVGKFLESQGHDPAVGSQAETEHRTYMRGESIVTAWSIGIMLIEFGGDHLTAFVKHATEPVEVIACWTCVRSMLESCALSAWLFDPSIDAHSRAGRAFALRYEGMDQQLKFGRVANIDPAEIANLEAHVDAVEKVAMGLGFPAVKDKKLRRIGIAQQMPGATDMIKMMLNEEKMYRMLSGVAHGHFWAIHSLSFAPAVTPNMAIGNTSVKAFTKTPNMNGLGLLGLCLMCSLARPLWNYCLYFGSDKLRLEEIFEKAADKLRMTPTRRFWRN